MVTVTRTVELSLTENLIPVVIHAKQYDNMTRQIKCSIYQDNTLISLDSSVSVNITGTRSDGGYFQYNSSVDSSVAYVLNGCVCFWVTSLMTKASGRVPVDITLTDGNGKAIGTFSLILSVEKAAVESEGLTTASYSALVETLAENIASMYVNDSGYLIIDTNDSPGITVTSDGEGGITVDY
ncbi:MAG: BppU family phage baseplate upper protein [Clostridiales bacterium]|nr:BppU family phage baseplate upper protein [Clostridiales bacterium]